MDSSRCARPLCWQFNATRIAEPEAILGCKLRTTTRPRLGACFRVDRLRP